MFAAATIITSIPTATSRPTSSRVCICHIYLFLGFYVLRHGPTDIPEITPPNIIETTIRVSE
jgi:hypothetical protein